MGPSLEPSRGPVVAPPLGVWLPGFQDERRAPSCAAPDGAANPLRLPKQAVAASLALEERPDAPSGEPSTVKPRRRAGRAAEGHLRLALIPTVAHELRGPLHALQLAVEMMAEAVQHGPIDRQQLHRHLAVMRRQTIWLQGLVENVLVAAQYGEGPLPLERHPADLRGLVEDIRPIVEPLLVQRDQTLRLALPATLPLVPADPRWLGQALINLLLNGAKYGPAAAPIDVRATVQGVGSGRVVRVTVADRGPGVPRHERARLFDPFFRGSAAVPSAAPGVGLGLGIVRLIVQAHGGRVGMRNRPAGGAAFWFEVPIPAALPGGLSLLPPRLGSG